MPGEEPTVCIPWWHLCPGHQPLLAQWGHQAASGTEVVLIAHWNKHGFWSWTCFLFPPHFCQHRSCACGNITTTGLTFPEGWPYGALLWHKASQGWHPPAADTFSGGVAGLQDLASGALPSVARTHVLADVTVRNDFFASSLGCECGCHGDRGCLLPLAQAQLSSLPHRCLMPIQNFSFLLNLARASLFSS